MVTNLNKKKGCAFNEVNKVVFEVFGSFNHSHVNNIVNTVISNRINLNKKIKKNVSMINSNDLTSISPHMAVMNELIFEVFVRSIFDLPLEYLLIASKFKIP